MLDELATIVSATQFELIDPTTGLPSLDVVKGSFTSPYSGNTYANDAEMQLHHHAAVGDSKLAWNVAPVTNSDAVILQGPYTASTGRAPTLTLEHNGAAVPDPLDVADLRTAAASATLITDTTNNTGTARLASNGKSILRTDANAGTGACQLDANGTEIFQVDTNGLAMGPPASLRTIYPTIAWGWAGDSGSNLNLSTSWQTFVSSGAIPVRPGDFIDLYGECSARVDTYVNGCNVYAQLGYFIGGVFQGLIGTLRAITFIAGAADAKMLCVRGIMYNNPSGPNITTSNFQAGLLLLTPDSGGMGQSKPYAWGNTGICTVQTISSK
jgi:hypothetical protein